jgi:hypothetical protein
MKFFSKSLAVLLIALFAFPLATFAQPQITPTPQAVALNYSQAESLTLSLSASTLAVQVGVLQPINVTATYNFSDARIIYGTAWLSSPTAALSSGLNNIPSSSVLASSGLVSQAQACTLNTQVGVTQLMPGAVTGAVCMVFFNQNTPGTPIGGWIGTGTINGIESIELAPGAYTAGNYTGTLNFGLTAD